MSGTLVLDLDRITDLPAGTVANVVTYLEMRQRPDPRPLPPRADLALARLTGRDLDRYLAIYRRLGERWLWWSRLTLARSKLAAILDDTDVEAWVVVRDGEDAGLLELDCRASGEVELAFFGVVEGLIGSGAGRWLMEQAIAKAWARAPRRVFVHTCTFDHPGAVDFYQRSGFASYKSAIEWAPDPRAGGVLPRTAGPHVPLIEPGGEPRPTAAG